MQYFGNRQNATNSTPEELDLIYKSIADNFGLNWLKQKGSNPLQILWNRKDFLSTNELYFFGSCIKNLSEIDQKWVTKQVKHIKSDQRTSQLGALFEINALGMLSTSLQKTVPTKGDNPGFDGILSLTQEKSMRISLKSYGDSTHYRDFADYAKKFEQDLKKVLKEKGILSIQIIIDAPHDFPSKENWKALTNSLPDILSNVQQGVSKALLVANFWLVFYGDLKDDYQEFHRSCNSYTLLMTTPFHKNEVKNLVDKLNGACSNLVKHSKLENENIINTVFVHLPESASILQCKEWANNYFIEFPDKPVSGIILYQPTVSVNQEGNNFIHHCFQLAFREDKVLKWNPLGINIQFTLPVGIINDVPSATIIVVESNGKRQEIDFKNRYSYQRGNLYLESVSNADGTKNGNIKNVASGIFSHSVFQLTPDSEPLMLSGHFAPVDKLLIL